MPAGTPAFKRWLPFTRDSIDILRVHKLATLRSWVSAALNELWAEQHPGRPLQLQFPLEAAA
jgi:hypothetical protein